MIVIGRFSYDR